jgi:hypothetical protein
MDLDLKKVGRFSQLDSEGGAMGMPGLDQTMKNLFQ